MLIDTILIIAFGFCHIGIEIESMYADEDKNAFLSQFGESFEDQMSRVSVRSSVIELVQVVCLDAANNQQAKLEQVFSSLWCDTLPTQVIAT